MSWIPQRVSVWWLRLRVWFHNRALARAIADVKEMEIKSAREIITRWRWDVVHVFPESAHASWLDGIKGLEKWLEIRDSRVIYIEGIDPFEDAHRRGYSTSGYYFWDETDAYVEGPYKTMTTATDAAIVYFTQLNQTHSDRV